MKKLLTAMAICWALSGSVHAAVNINTATKQELTSLTGVGEKRAQDIIDYRTKNGPFKTIDDLEKVPGIGPGLMKRIRSQITTTGKSTIEPPVSGNNNRTDNSTQIQSQTKKAEKK